ncbi:hypothetical protein [Terribacillus saccharophilus]|uniref:hypothetical protein n=1 Tax=Terribacillus saccharophilus TaxID=361277 RepID=UPI003982BBE0
MANLNEILSQSTSHSPIHNFNNAQELEEFKRSNPDHSEVQRMEFLDGQLQVKFSVHTYLIRFSNKSDMDRWLTKNEDEYEILRMDIPTVDYRYEPGETYEFDSYAGSSYSRSGMVERKTTDPIKVKNYYVVHLGNGGKPIK